jgi:hypothetical protein
MTEFKKVQQLLEIVRDHVLHVRTTLMVAEHPYAAYSEARSVLVTSSTDLLKRDRKLFLKATETDPNKQIYNENMCAKLIDLHGSVLTFFLEGLHMDAESCERVCEAGAECDAQFANACPLADELQELYENAVVIEANSSAWAATTANTLAALLSMQQVGRVVLEVEEKNSSRQLFTVDAVASRAAARAAEDARAAAIWNAEMQRRDREAQLLLPARVADVIERCKAVVDKVHLSRLCKRLAALLREVHANPERQGIRTLRCVPLSLEHFGHPGASLPDGCSCQTLNAAAEAVLRMVGYRARYNTKPSYNIVVQEFFTVSAAPFPMPCGRSSNEHVYHPVGYELYGERTLVLEEPDPQTEMDAWCSWHEAFEVAIGDLLRDA